MKIKILKKVYLKSDLTKYDENESHMKIYEPEEIIDNVNDKYLDKFKKAKDVIKILDKKENKTVKKAKKDPKIKEEK